MDLDNANAVTELDSSNMLARIRELPDQCREAWRQTQALDLPYALGDVDQVVIAGMGGSAMGGALLKDLLADECPVPITLVRGYALPAFARGPETLVVACSYSGNTEETLSCFDQAIERETHVLAITTGGQLRDLAEDVGAPTLRFDYPSQPRAALGYGFILLLGSAHRLGLTRDYSTAVSEASSVMDTLQAEIELDVPAAENTAKQLAQRVHERIPVVYGGGFLSSAANRWKTQFNENAKSWAFCEVLPELDHNAVVGLRIPEVARKRMHVLALRSSLDRARLAKRWDVTREVLVRESVSIEEVWGRGDTKLAQMMSLIHFGDYVSYYAALLNQVDPTPVETIAFLKDRLAELGTAAD